MMSMLILRICLILLSFNRFSDSLICYFCTGCNDPFRPGDYIGLSVADNAGYDCTKTSSSYVVTRDASTSCTHVGSPGYGQWCCRTDFCNNATIIAPMKIFIFIAMGIIMVV